MRLSIEARTGKVKGGNLISRLALRSLWHISILLKPLKIRGFWRVARVVSAFSKINERVWVEIKDDVILSVDINDPYWNGLITPYFIYEPELHYILKHLEKVDYVFLDCGANIGYWSCLVTSSYYGKKNSIAIEPSSSNYRLLKKNNEKNGNLFETIHHALSEFNNKTLTLYNLSDHASASLIKKETLDNTSKYEKVQSITIDEVSNKFNIKKPILIKLDIEGVEIDALKGAIEVLKQMPLIVYEDHGSDTDSVVSEYIMNELGMHVWFIDENGTIEKIDRLGVLKSIKTNKTKGYNFISCHALSPFFDYFNNSFAVDSCANT